MELSNKTKVKIGEKNYEFGYPNVGQILNIETSKMTLSGGIYGELVKSQHKTAVELLNLIDGVSYFSILNPEFGKDFDIVNFTEMEVLTQKRISAAFVLYWKWLLGVEAEINKLTSDAANNSK